MSQIRLMKPYVSFNEVEAEFRDVFDTGIFTRGRYVEELRADIVRYTGSKHAFLATSATTALWVCLKLLEIGPGDEVVVSDFSFPATANVVEDLGARPLFADVSSQTYNMRPDALRSLLTEKTKAVIFVDALGNPAGLHEIKDICREHGIPLIEDAACSIGSSEFGRPCGSVADLTCFSFHPRKLISSGEGGAITTDRDDWAEWLSVKLAHGARPTENGLDFVDYGYNFRLTELQAIMASKQLAKIDEIVDSRNAIREVYRAQLEPIGFVAQHAGNSVRHNVQSLVFSVPPTCNRDALVAGLRSEGVESTIGTYAMSATTYYANKYGTRNDIAASLMTSTITLPCYDNVDVERVAAAIRHITKHSG
ncbi:DegT/DnrJ/EryC1/StrS family aminotransferase [Peteryoungia algae]|uniref:DegT/DnrJ/EryC1/StrS family aminotransferase n=1 Tax=Peteryoungia algae TaxID=2919917 RepID=A0ABT0CZZ4_9HYPH|nr:DegT/DnrJ/EryC1/StrS family aminotransferase [Rhizobium sp. SSM4.3]MCJ8238696.1 DegT/DnrJ/EryC1/StrS family aminotransferase [Rhizobium sp. SSM4.3]